MKKLLKKNRFLLAIITAGLIILMIRPRTGLEAMNFTGKNLLNFLFMLTPVFICIGLMDIWIDRNTMIRIMGKQTGIKGLLIALGLGMLTAVPLYALLPVAGMLLKKGSRIANVLIFLCASTSIRIPLLLFEISSLGWRFTLVRFILNLIVVFLSAGLIEGILTDSDQKAIYDHSAQL